MIGAVRDVIVAPEDPRALIEALAAPATRLVTLTITEKGYRPDPDADPNGRSRGAAFYLAAALNLRRERSLAPFAILSCDNLPHNGAVAAAAVLAEAERTDPRLRDWIAGRVAFPQAMVDRIVPATTESDIDALAARIGLVDQAMVKSEPYWQWVIEEFPGERPDFAAAGVQMTTDVGPWEDAKLRLLNGAHSAIAYLGGLAEVEFVDRFVADDAGRRLVEALGRGEATLDPPPGSTSPPIAPALMDRFANAALAHRTRQIAMDGSQKLPQRLLAPIARRLERNQPIDALALAVASWIRWQGGRTDAGDGFRRRRSACRDHRAPARAPRRAGRASRRNPDARSFRPASPPIRASATRSPPARSARPARRAGAVESFAALTYSSQNSASGTASTAHGPPLVRPRQK